MDGDVLGHHNEHHKLELSSLVILEARSPKSSGCKAPSPPKMLMDDPSGFMCGSACAFSVGLNFPLLQTPGTGLRPTLSQCGLLSSRLYLQRPYFQVSLCSELLVDVNLRGHYSTRYRGATQSPRGVTPSIFHSPDEQVP